ncbi:hypothetical protein LOTGIDRAFT_205604 [Lottia gigantea]|uniref:Nucleoporin Nup88 n=1 Tax=Lottia gigantea TaxID=225164 RepID=V4AS97_LOTGI|nr:hypothetical protein LOTGIDRAFT_205604 [Lottia gigantea]ESO97745.1 hypothetical protein LOTGIDRAFT_205604 [Lottia gigantea]
MAAYSSWRSRLNNLQFCKQLRENNGKESHQLTNNTKHLISVIDGDLYAWDNFSANIIYFNLKTLLNTTGGDENNETSSQRHQTLLCTNAPTYEVEGLLFNLSGSHIAIWGHGGIHVIELPRRWGKYAEFEGGKSVISCRTISVAERYCVSQGGVKIQQIAWHPGSSTDSHLVILTSDNILSVYDMTEQNKASQTINLDSIHSDLNISPTKISFSAALGERAVAFDFAKPIELKPKKKVLGIQPDETDNIVWPVYLVKGNGNVCIAYTTTLMDREINLPVQGPLMMHPPADDNYEEPALYVIESVELELSLTTPQYNTEELSSDDFTCPVKLQRDPSTYDRYHCSHSAGVHSVALPWAQSLHTFISDDNQQCVVEHVICTKPLTSSPTAPIQGLSIVTDPSLGITLLVLTSDYLFTALPLGSKYRSVALPLVSDALSTTVTSPLRKLNRVPFDHHIAKILQRTSSNPLLKSSSRTEVSQQECFQLLSRATQVLREEYIQKQDQARIEIETRARILRDQKKNQNKDLQRLEESRNILRDKAECVSEKLENSQHLQERNLKRLELIMRKIQSRLPMLSDAEKVFSKEIQEISDNIKAFEKNLDQLKKKQEYQKQKIERDDKSISNNPLLKPNHTTHLKEILKEESDEISNLMKKVNQLKLDTNLSLS